jgi:hypothetical protein
MDASRSRREARSCAIAGLARWNAKDRSNLHSRNDAYPLQTHAISGILPEWRGIRRRHRVSTKCRLVASQWPFCCFAVADCSGRRSGSEKLWLLTCDGSHQKAMTPGECSKRRSSSRRRRCGFRRDFGEGKTGRKWCRVMVTLGRAVYTHRMRLGGSRQSLRNGGCRQRVYDAGNRPTRGRKRHSTHTYTYKQVLAGGSAESARWHAALRSRGPVEGFFVFITCVNKGTDEHR